MAYAKLYVSAVEMGCAGCGEGLVEPSTGSYMWTAADLTEHATAGTVLTCRCGTGNLVRTTTRVTLQ